MCALGQNLPRVTPALANSFLVFPYFQVIVGKLINVLSSYDESLKVLDFLSEELTGYPTSGFFGREFNNELITIFQSMRPKLIELYQKLDQDDYYDWFEK